MTADTTRDPSKGDDPLGPPPLAQEHTGASVRDQEPAAPVHQRNWGELALSAVLIVLGLYLIIDGSSITVPGSSNTVGPRFFPYLVGGATVVVGAVLLIKTIRGDQGPAEEGEDIDPDATTSWRSVGIITLAFLAHALLINVIGWPLSVTLMFGVVAWSLGARGIIRPLVAGGIASVIIWIIFVKALGVVLPGGILLELATSWF